MLKSTTRRRASARQPKRSATDANIDWFGLLARISKSVRFASRNIPATLDILKRDLSVLGVDALAVWTIESEMKFLRIEASSGLSQNFIRYLNQTDRIKLGQGLVGRVMQDRKLRFSEEIRTDKKIGAERWHDILQEEGIVSILGSPMVIKSTLIGTLSVYYRGQAHRFYLPERKFMETLSNHLAITIQNIKYGGAVRENQNKLLEQLKKFQDLQRVTEYLNAHISESIETSLKFLADYLGPKFQSKSIAILDWRDDNRLHLAASYGISREFADYLAAHPQTMRDETIAGLAVRERKTQISSRVMSDARIAKPWRTLLSIERRTAVGAFPLIVRKSIVGVLEVYYERTHVFSEDELSVLNTFAQFISISLDNIRTFRSLISEKNNTQAMLYSLHEGIIVYDLDGHVIELNPRCEALVLVKKAEVAKRLPKELETSDDPGARNIFLISNVMLSDFETKELSLDESAGIILRITLLPLRNDKNMKIGSIRVLHDITAEKSVERLKSSFVSTASHQMRTPLTGIKWALHALMQNEADKLGPPQYEIISNAFTTTQSLIALVNDLLDVSRIEEGRYGYKFAMADIGPILRRIADNLSNNIKRGQLDVELKIPADLPQVSVDPEKINTALQNIVENAVNYTLPGGKICIAVSSGWSLLTVSVADTGIGIVKEDQKFLFNKFFRAKNAILMRTEGSGLGLYISKNIIEKHNGKISVDSAEGRGSTFFIQLPMRPEAMPKGVVSGL